jgi:hypothetical protein
MNRNEDYHLEPKDYVVMQYEIRKEINSNYPSIDVEIYNEDKPIKVKAIYDLIDQSIIDKCKKKFFIKAYFRDRIYESGINTQSGNFKNLGYSNDSTIAVIKLICMNMTGWSLQFMQTQKLEVCPVNGNWLDLRRKNIRMHQSKKGENNLWK